MLACLGCGGAAAAAAGAGRDPEKPDNVSMGVVARQPRARLFPSEIPPPRTEEDFLRCAIIANDVVKVQRMLHPKNRISVNSADPRMRSRTALHVAAMFDPSGAIVRMLLARGARVDAEDAYGETPLDLAVWCGVAANLPPLLAKGARPDRRNVRFQRGWTPMHVAAYLDNDGDTLPLLLAAGADQSRLIQSTVGNTALHIAAYFGRICALALLVRNTDDCDVRNDAFQTPLHCAAASGAAGSVLFLLKSGADVNARDKFGRTPLHAASVSRRVAASLAAAGGQPSIVHALVSGGALLDALSAAGRTPLMCAILAGRPATARALLELGADPRADTGEPLMRTPLHLAAERGDEGSAVAILDAVRDSGHHIMPDDESAGDKTDANGTITGSATGAVAAVTASASVTTTALEATVPLPPPASVPDAEGRTPLHLAALHSLPGMVRLLLARDEGAGCVNARDVSGATPLLLVCRHLGNSGSASTTSRSSSSGQSGAAGRPQESSAQEVVAALLGAGASAAIPDYGGSTCRSELALFAARVAQHTPVVMGAHGAGVHGEAAPPLPPQAAAIEELLLSAPEPATHRCAACGAGEGEEWDAGREGKSAQVAQAEPVAGGGAKEDGPPHVAAVGTA